MYTKHIETRKLDLYGTRRLSFPTPRFFVCYFDEANRRDREIMRLSDSFIEGPGDLEVKVTVINCNEGRNEAIMKACETLRGYAHLIALERHFRKEKGMDAASAAHRAVSQCIEDDFLVDYLVAHRAEVVGMLFTIEDEERAMRVHWEAVARELREEMRDEIHEEVRNEVRNEARAEARAELVANIAAMIQSGKLSADDAVEGFGLTEGELSAVMVSSVEGSSR